MVKAAKKDGVYLRNISWYCSYSTQKYLFNMYLSYDSYRNVITYCAKPGYSEHQTGMAIDVAGSSSTLQQSFGNTKEGKWVKNNAHKYGFVVRYLKGKQHITGYIYEPWHIRYVGGKFKSAKIHATSIKN